MCRKRALILNVYAFNYVRDNDQNGLDTRASYPWRGKDLPCNIKKTREGKNVGVRVGPITIYMA